MTVTGQQPSRRGVLKSVGVIGATTGPFALLPAPASAEAVTPFDLHVPDEDLRDLRRRLAATRWPERETVADTSQGAQSHRVRRLAAYWQRRYDWRRAEARLNNLGQYRTRLDGLGIHFLHVRSRHRDAMPLLLTHGWPGSVVEFLDVVGPLTDPMAFGGRSADAFHVVIPSLPGFGFSDRPAEPGWDLEQIARAWAQLMTRLGYRRYLAQGGDWGSGVTTKLAALQPIGLAGIHLNFGGFEPPLSGEPTPEEREALAKRQEFLDTGAGYAIEQATRPQTVSYGLTDSPVGQAAWIFEKYVEWTDSGKNPEDLLGYDRMLDNIMLYWLPATAASSARIYWESWGDVALGDIRVPVGFSDFPGELFPMPKVWAERAFDRLVYYNKVRRGGHFAAFEQPELFTEEIRKFARLVR